MDEALVKTVFSDEEFVKSLFQLETPEEVQTALADRGIDLSVPDIIKIKDLLLRKIQSGGELSDEELEGVTGGVLLASTITAMVWGAAIAGALVGTSVPILLGTAWLTDFCTDHRW